MRRIDLMLKQILKYQRILGVRTEASVEEIKAAYRKLMVTMKMHPDLGGDHAAAAQINEAYAAVMQDAKQDRYGHKLLRQNVRKYETLDSEAEPEPETSPVLLSAPQPPIDSTPDRAVATAGPRCPLCHNETTHFIDSETRCAYCYSPLCPPPALGKSLREIFGRRVSLRAAKSNSAILYPPGKLKGIHVTMRDLSLSGMSFYSETTFAVNQVLRFSDPTLEAVISVVSCRKHNGRYSVHARLLTVAFQIKDHVFVSARG